MTSRVPYSFTHNVRTYRNHDLLALPLSSTELSATPRPSRLTFPLAPQISVTIVHCILETWSTRLCRSLASSQRKQVPPRVFIQWPFGRRMCMYVHNVTPTATWLASVGLLKPLQKPKFMSQTLPRRITGAKINMKPACSHTHFIESLLSCIDFFITLYKHVKHIGCQQTQQQPSNVNRCEL